MEKTWEKKLNISTQAAYHEKDDTNHSRYEPTSYAVLERLAKSGYIDTDDILVDYGCGKGRVSFYINHAVGCDSIGIEYDPELCAAAEANLSGYSARRGKVSFKCISAEDHLPENETCFYFFNPFSEKILRSVLGRIYESYYTSPRTMKLFFYFPLDSYLTMLMTEDMLTYAGDIDCRDIFGTEDMRERIVVFTVG